MVPQHPEESQKRNEQWRGFVCKAIPTLIENCCSLSTRVWFCLWPLSKGLEEFCLSRAASPPSPGCILASHEFQRAAGAEVSDAELCCAGNLSSQILQVSYPGYWVKLWERDVISSQGRKGNISSFEGQLCAFQLLWLLRFGEEEGKMNSFYPSNDLGVGDRGSRGWLTREWTETGPVFSYQVKRLPSKGFPDYVTSFLLKRKRRSRN